jgi:serine/threonine-protein kinase RsbW
MTSRRTQSPWRDAGGISIGWHRAYLSATEEVTPLIDSVAAAMRSHSYSDKDVFGVRLALEEALVNAIEHGHRHDPSKRVAIRYRISPTHTLVEVKDEGPGFDPSAVPDPTDPENLERPSGRGLLLMRRYTSWLRYNVRGNCVTLCRYRSQD